MLEAQFEVHWLLVRGELEAACPHIHMAVRGLAAKWR